MALDSTSAFSLTFVFILLAMPSVYNFLALAANTDAIKAQMEKANVGYHTYLYISYVRLLD
jgi:hypothetical protein